MKINQLLVLNSLRAVFTSVRELVENSLDAAEHKGVTPNISIKLRRLKKQELIELMGTNIIKIDDKKIDFIELSCKDNGIGVPKSLIPQLFGTVLAGTKYGVQQARGRFGLGSKMVFDYMQCQRLIYPFRLQQDMKKII